MIFELKAEWSQPIRNVTLLPHNNRGWGMFSLQDTPSGTQDPYVEIKSLVLEAEKNDDVTGSIMILTTKAFTGNICNLKPSPSVDFAIKDFTLKKGAQETVDLKLWVNKTDTYHILLCSNSGGQFNIVSGQAIWFNPYGYLPGRVYKKLPLSGVLALLSLVVVVGYMVAMILRRKILLNIQYGIFLVMVVGVIEVSSWYFYRLARNNSGEASAMGLMSVVLIASLKRTATRVLLLLMAMGVGVVKWTIGNTRIRIAVLAVAYLCSTFLFEMMRETEAISLKGEVVAQWVKFSVTVSQSMLDTCFYYWIILSMIRTIQQLTLRRQTLKLDMYKWFFGVLAVAGLLSLIFAIYVLIFRFTGAWRNEWVQDIFWEFLFFLVMTAIAVLWRPRANNTRYGYAEFFPNAAQPEPPNQEEASEILEIISGGELTHRRRGPINDTEGGSAHATQDSQSYEAAREKNLADLSSSGVFGDESEFFSIIGGLDEEEDGDNSLENQLKKID